MKTKNFVLQLIVLLSFNYEIKSQCNLNDLLIRLNSENPNIRVEAIVDIMVCNLTEAVSGLEARFDIENKLYIADYLLMALDSLHSPNIVSLAHQLLLNAENYDYENSRFSLLNSKLYATQILFKYNDFTTSQIAFDYVDEFGGAYSLIPLEIFDKIIKNVPNLELEAKSRVERILNQCEWEFAKTKSIKILAKNYGSEYQNLILDYFINGETFPIRSTAFDMLFYINFPNLHSLLLDRLPLDDHWTIRLNIADSLLKVWGTPYDFKVVKSYQPSESQKTARSLMGFAIRDFVPPRPSTSTSVSDMVSNLTNTADTLLNYTWLGDLTFVNSLKAKLNQAKTYLLAGDSLSCAVEVKVFQDDVNAVYKDSLNLDPRFVTIEGWKFLYWNAQYILDRLPEPPANPNLVVSLKNSLGNPIPTSNVQYYEGSWKDAVNNGDGTFTVITTKPTVSIRVFYEYASMQADNVPAQNNTYTFQTVLANVQLKNSFGSLIDTSTVQYYAGAWRSFGTTTNGVATKELLPINYSFRMTYEFASIDKQQNLSVDPTVVFQTVNAQVQLKNSLGNLIDVGTVQYYAGAWRSFGTTTNGVAAKELLPINYSFRMTYEFASIDKQQNLSVDPTVVFQTVNAAVQLKNSLGNLIDVGTVQYYAGAWRNFGTTTNGVATKELLPISYSFRMSYEFASIDKQQDLSTNTTIVFQTVNSAVQLKNSLGNPIDVGTVQYYAGAWRNFGITTNGVATKELLPINYSFRMTYEFLSKDKQQNLSTNPVVDFQTVLCTVKVTNSTNQPLNNATVKYYAGAPIGTGWRDLGVTNVEGLTTKELLPQNISFRASYGSTSLDKQQDIGTNSLVEILLNVP